MKLLHSICVASTALFCTGAMTTLGGSTPQEPVQIPNTFAAGTPARASEVNENFQALADGANANGLLIEENRLSIEGLAAGRELVRTVAKSGAAFTTIADALASITDAAADRPYRVDVAPGLYEPSAPLIVPSFVRLSGAGMGSTVIQRAAADSSQSSEAAVITLQDGAQLSDLTVRNPGNASTFSIGVIGFSLGEDSSIERVACIVDGAGGVGHFAYLFTDSNLVVRDSTGHGSGATGANAGMASNNFSGQLAQLHIEGCRFESEAGNVGIGMQLTRTAAVVRNSYVYGSQHAISATIDGTVEVQSCMLRSDQELLMQTGNSKLQIAGSKLSGLNPIGIASNFQYVHCYKANYSPVVNGSGSSVQ